MKSKREKSVLIIDDDSTEVMIAKRVISKIDPELRTDEAFSGESGLALLRNGKHLPMMILLDLKMPGLSGIDVVLQIRSDKRLKNVPVIIMTNSTLESDKQESIEAGADKVLHKAASIDQFKKDITALLKQYLKN